MVVVCLEVSGKCVSIQNYRSGVEISLMDKTRSAFSRSLALRHFQPTESTLT